MLSFQQLIPRLNTFWAEQGCALLQPYDMEVGAGTFHPATFLRALGPEPWNAAYVQPSRRPTDGRYGENPNRLQHYYQYQVILKPSPADVQDLYLGSLDALGIDPAEHDIRFVEDDWESPTLGAWGLGWEVWLDGMEITQFTYFQQVGGIDCKPVSARSPTGSSASRCTCRARRQRLRPRVGDGRHLRRRVPPERGRAVALQLRASRTPELLFRHFGEYEAEARRLVEAAAARCRPTNGAEVLARLQPARRARRDLGHRARRATSGACARSRARWRKAYYASRERLGFPMLLGRS